MVQGLHRVVVTGLGAVTPIGNDVPSYWEGLSTGRNGVAGITLFDASRHACRFAAEVKDFDPRGWLEPKESKRWDRFCQFAVVAAKQAVADGGAQRFTDEQPQARRHRHRLWGGRPAGGGNPGQRAQGPRPRPGEPVLRADDDPQHGHGPGGDRPRRPGPQQRRIHGLRRRLQCHRRCLPPDPAGPGRRDGVRWGRVGDHAPGGGGFRQRQGPVVPQRRPRHRQPSL
jgi:hypothetical protein